MKITSLIRKSVDTFFFKSCSRTEFIVFFRVNIGLITLIHFLSTLRDFERFFSSKSIVPQDIIAVFNPNWLISFSDIVRFLNSYGISESTVMITTKWLFILFCTSIIIGFYSRFSAFCLMLLQVSIMKGGAFFIYGVDFFTSMSLFYVSLFPSDNYFSIRNKWRKHRISSLGGNNFTPIKRMFQLHLCIAYFFSGFDKVLGFNWHNGEAIWKAINLPYANRDFVFDFTYLAEQSWILVLVGWVTIVTEMFYPIFIWVSFSRKFWLFLTISMHLGIALILNLYFFSAIMIIWNLTNFYFEENRAFKYSPSPKLNKFTIFQRLIEKR